MMRRWLVTTVLLCSCVGERSGDAARRTVGFTASDTIHLAVDARFGDVDSFGRITRLQVSGQHLIAHDALQPPHLVVLDRLHGTILNRVGPHGRGPGELEYADAWAVASRSTLHLWTFDLRNIRMTLWDLRATADSAVVALHRFTMPFPGYKPLRTEWGAVAIADFQDAALYRTDSTGAVLSAHGSLPFSIPSNRMSRRLNNSHLIASPALDRFAVSYYSTSRIQMYDMAGGLVWEVEGPISTPAPIRADNAYGYELPFPKGYGIGTMSADRLYVTFCGCGTPDRAELARRTRSLMASEVIHVFSRDGTFLTTLDIGSTPAWALAAAPDDSALYVAVEEPYPHIVRYSLAPLGV